MNATPRTLAAKADWSRVYEFDFARFAEMRSGEAVSSASVSATPAGLTIGSPIVNRQAVQATVSGGEAGTVYTLTCSIVTGDGAALSQDGYLAVE